MDRYIYTVRSPSLAVRGYIARSFSGASPKVLTYNELPGDPFIGWAGKGPVTVIVEDWVSAEKIVASVGFAGAVALNGTYLSLEMVREIHETSDGGQVILALDKDAWAKSIGYLQQYGNMFNPRLRVWRLEDDLKYVPAELIKKAILDDRPDFTADTQHYRTTDYPGNHYGQRGL